jgi:hypothetical protein
MWLPALPVLALALVSCGSDSASRRTVETPPTASAGTPESTRKPQVLDRPLALGAGKKGAEFVPDQLFGFAEMPGGNLGNFVSEAGTPYQRFAITHTNQNDATVTLALLVRRLGKLKTIHGYEGFRGPLGERNIWLFRHKNIVAGVLGLPDREAKIEFARYAYSLR